MKDKQLVTCRQIFINQARKEVGIHSIPLLQMLCDLIGENRQTPTLIQN